MAVPLPIKLVRLSDNLLPNSLRTYGNEPHENHKSLKKTTKDGGCKGGGDDDGETAKAVGVSLIGVSTETTPRFPHSIAKVVRITKLSEHLKINLP